MCDWIQSTLLAMFLLPPIGDRFKVLKEVIEIGPNCKFSALAQDFHSGQSKIFAQGEVEIRDSGPAKGVRRNPGAEGNAEAENVGMVK